MCGAGAEFVWEGSKWHCATSPDTDLAFWTLMP